MHESLTFGLAILCAAGAGLLAVQSRTLSRRLRVPAPAVFLAAAALAVRWFPSIPDPSPRTVQRVVTVCLIAILFEGGMQIGMTRLRGAMWGVLSLGLLGTVLTVVAAAVLAHLLLGGSWYVAVLVATAIAPTDPAVVFSVLGAGEIEGPAGTVLEGESGANDPVGIALMVALLSGGALTADALGHVAGTFVLQMAVGLVVGLVGSRLLLVAMRRIPLPAGLHPLRTLLGAGVVYGLAAVAHGSGFLAVFVAGLLLGDEEAPHKAEVARFHAAVASLAEVVAFAYLGLTVDLDVLARSDVWVPGLALGALLAVAVRPLISWPLLRGAGLTRRQEAFVMFAGLKGAVPLLLGSMLLALSGGDRLYGVVVVVVLVSVIGQGTLVPTAARRLGLRTE
ncbi:MAG: potassium/hydrogen antiporter [Frankiales bacterium]|nr:potassium/hydrogen antiporter [Frankiales bacterium]